MKIEIFPESKAIARRGAEIVAAEARAAVMARGRFVVAVSSSRITVIQRQGAFLKWVEVTK